MGEETIRLFGRAMKIPNFNFARMRLVKLIRQKRPDLDPYVRGMRVTTGSGNERADEDVIYIMYPDEAVVYRDKRRNHSEKSAIREYRRQTRIDATSLVGEILEKHNKSLLRGGHTITALRKARRKRLPPTPVRRDKPPLTPSGLGAAGLDKTGVGE